jgi:hypothetical protein
VLLHLGQRVRHGLAGRRGQARQHGLQAPQKLGARDAGLQLVHQHLGLNQLFYKLRYGLGLGGVVGELGS